MLNPGEFGADRLKTESFLPGWHEREMFTVSKTESAGRPGPPARWRWSWLPAAPQLKEIKNETPNGALVP